MHQENKVNTHCYVDPGFVPEFTPAPRHPILPRSTQLGFMTELHTSSDIALVVVLRSASCSGFGLIPLVFPMDHRKHNQLPQHSFFVSRDLLLGVIEPWVDETALADQPPKHNCFHSVQSIQLKVGSLWCPSHAKI